MPEAKEQDKLAHPCFPQPRDGTARVWRYLDLPKLIWLLENRKLYLSRLDMLNDPHEGSTPNFIVSARDKQLLEEGDEECLQAIADEHREYRASTYVSCWRYGNAESEAMWRLYCPGDSGVAIQTTYQRLVQSVDNDPCLYIGCVTYIDYEREGYPYNNMLYPAMHKRISFEHEREVRIVKCVMKYRGVPEADRPPGLEIVWDVEKTLEAIYVNPYAPDYYHAVVCAILRRFLPSLEEYVRWSPMRLAPVY